LWSLGSGGNGIRGIWYGDGTWSGHGLRGRQNEGYKSVQGIERKWNEGEPGLMQFIFSEQSLHGFLKFFKYISTQSANVTKQLCLQI